MQVEMYADPAGRGGVLEAEGMVEIKFRTPELIAAMHRLDPVIASTRAEGGPGAAATIRAREPRCCQCTARREALLVVGLGCGHPASDLCLCCESTWHAQSGCCDGQASSLTASSC